MPPRNVTRRELLRIGAAAAAAEVAAVLLPGCGSGGTSPPSICSKLTDIEHIVIFIQENRSFDHYFGSYRGVHNNSRRVTFLGGMWGALSPSFHCVGSEK